MYDDLFNEMKRMQDKMDRMFNKLVANSSKPFAEDDSFWTPLSDVEDKEKEIVLKVDLPGMEEDDINLLADEGGVEITAERKEEKRKEEESMRRWERSYSGFKRQFSFPVEVKVDEITADYEKGVLTVRIPKKKSKKEKKKEKKKIKVE